MEHATDRPYRVGAVVYHEKVRDIWAAFGDWFATQHLPIAVTYYDDYETQVDALLARHIDTGWNTNLAYAHTLTRSDGHAIPIAMRDTDLGWRSHLVVPADHPADTLQDLCGATVGFGDADSPQAHLLPVHLLRRDGLDPTRDLHATRLDRDLGKHGDTGGAELAQLARLRAGELDACVLSSVVLDAVTRLGDADTLRVVWTSRPFNHCNFTVLTPGSSTSAARHNRFATLLLSMDASDPKLCEPMQLEMVNAWIPPQTDGYTDLLDALAAGPIVVG
jgi:phosphonate transport system substrate-binding protein